MTLSLLALFVHESVVLQFAYPRCDPPDLLFLVLRHNKHLDEEGTREVNGKSVMKVSVESGGTRVVAHDELNALGRFADRIGLGASLSVVDASARCDPRSVLIEISG